MDEFMSIPELQQNPLVKRVIDILDTDRNGSIDFHGLCISLTSLSFFFIFPLTYVYCASFIVTAISKAP